MQVIVENKVVLYFGHGVYYDCDDVILILSLTCLLYILLPFVCVQSGV